MGWRLLYRRTALPTSGALSDRLRTLYEGQLQGSLAVLNTPGFPLPTLEDAGLIQPVVPTVSRAIGGNWLIARPGAPVRAILAALTFDHRCRGNLVIAGSKSCAPARLHFKASNGTVILGDQCTWFADIDVRLSSDRETLYWGRAASSNGTSIVISGEDRSILIGEDCMFAAGTSVRTSDLHSIVALDDGAWLNPPADVVLQPHVWIGQDAMVAKGVTIGAGSIVGAKSLVTRNVPATSIAAGIPAKVLRSGCSWDRATVPPPAAGERLRTTLSIETARGSTL
jgi:hypothetical protein